MKKTILALFAAAALFACKEEHKAGTNLHISGNIKGFKQGKLYIKRIVDTNLVTLDSIIINGKSTFNSDLNIEEPEMLYLILDRGQTNSVDNQLPFFAEPGDITINSDIEGFYSRAKVTGSENQKLYESFLEIKKRYTNMNLDLMEKNLEATKTGNTQQLDSIEKASEKITKTRYLATINFALNNADKPIGPYIALSEVYDANIKFLDTIQKSMTPEIAKSHYGKMLTEFIDNRKKEDTIQ